MSNNGCTIVQAKPESNQKLKSYEKPLNRNINTDDALEIALPVKKCSKKRLQQGNPLLKHTKDNNLMLFPRKLTKQEKKADFIDKMVARAHLQEIKTLSQETTFRSMEPSASQAQASTRAIFLNYSKNPANTMRSRMIKQQKIKHKQKNLIDTEFRDVEIRQFDVKEHLSKTQNNTFCNNTKERIREHSSSENRTPQVINRIVNKINY